MFGAHTGKMLRMPKLLFFALFFVGTMGAVALYQNGYLGRHQEGMAPVLAFCGFAFAFSTSFLMFHLLRLSRWVAARLRPSYRYKPSSQSLRLGRVRSLPSQLPENR